MRAWPCAVIALVLFLANAVSAAAQTLPRDAVVAACDFASADPLRGFTKAGTGAAEIVKDGDRPVLRLERAAGARDGAVTLRFDLPVEKVRGCTLLASARVKAENVSAKPNGWNGIKFMLPVQAPGGLNWPQARVDTGSFAWQTVRLAVRVPEDATGLALVLGLEQVTGQVWFDQVKLVVGRTPTLPPPPAPGPRYLGHDVPRLRGAMVGPQIDEAGLRTFGAEWKANLIRWQLVRNTRPGQRSTMAEYDRWLEAQLARLDQVLPWCQQYGLRVVIDLHSPPGGQGTEHSYVGSDAGLFTDKACQDRFVSTWEQIARRYKDVACIWGYDLVNEPVEDAWFGGDCDDWPGLATRAAKAIRAIDPQRTLIVEPAEWGGPGGLRNFRPIAVPNVVYSVHMYLPHEFTHQGVAAGVTASVRYPGAIGGKAWDQAALRAALQPAIDFQQRYNMHIYIGEFSAIRWAPDGSAARYLRDLIGVMEEQGWDWTYHAFREFSGWSVEYGEDRNDTKPSATPTEREKLLREWFGKNQKP